jgi:hypothetical protein
MPNKTSRITDVGLSVARLKADHIAVEDVSIELQLTLPLPFRRNGCGDLELPNSRQRVARAGLAGCILAGAAAALGPSAPFPTARRHARLARIVCFELSLQFERCEVHPQRGQIAPQGHQF